MPIYSSLLHLGIAKEVTQGTAVVPTSWTPITNNAKPEDITKWIEDKGIRGAPVSPIATYPGPKSSTFAADGMFYPDVPPNFLVALLGTDTVTGTAVPYTHTVTLAQAQPPSYTLSLFNGYNERQYPGSMLEELGLKWAVDGALEYTTKWVGWPSAVGTTSVPVIGTTPPWLAWQSTMTIGGIANARLIGFDWTAKRKGDVVTPANNSQTPAFTYLGPLAVTGKLTFAIQDDTELTYLLNNTQPAVLITLTQPGTNGPTLRIQMSKCAFTKATPSFTKDWVEYDMEISALPNSSDSGSGSPISPVQFIVTNAQATAY